MNITRSKPSLFFLLALVLAIGITNAQDYQWAKNMGGISADRAASMQLDSEGNIYLTGLFYETADFDPGPGVANLISNGSADIFIAKYDVDGNYLWAKSMGGIEYDNGVSIQLNDAGQVYIIGRFQSTVDFDPGSGVTDITPAG